MPVNPIKQRLSLQKSGEILFNVVHEKKMDRTSVILYVPVPPGYCVEESKITTTPGFKRSPESIRKKILKVYADDRLSNQKKALEMKPLTGSYPKSETSIELLILKDDQAPGESKYFRYLFPGKDHAVSLKIIPGKGIDLDDSKIAGIQMDYNETSVP